MSSLASSLLGTMASEYRSLGSMLSTKTSPRRLALSAILMCASAFLASTALSPS